MIWNSSQYTYEQVESKKHLIPIDFNWKQYVLLNPDLERAGITSEQYALEHYIFYGIKEQRQYKLPDNQQIPENFNAKIYKYLNKDLLHLTDLQATQHFIVHGHRENRSYNINFDLDSNFDPRLYKLYNPDLYSLTDIQAIEHYVQHGHKEGRTYYAGIGYDTLVASKKSQNIDQDKKYSIVLINHDVSLTGAPLFLYDLYNYLETNNYFYNIIMIEPYPNNIMPKISNKLYHFNDPLSLVNIIEQLDPVLIYSNSLNIYVRNSDIFYYWFYKTIFHFHEIFQHFDSFVKIKKYLYNCNIKVVSQKIQSEFNSNGFTNVSIFPPFIEKTKLSVIDENKKYTPQVANNTRSIDTSKIIIGMSGSLCDRKNFQLFFDAALKCPDYEFIWIGGSEIESYINKYMSLSIIDMPDNLFWIPNTKNPYAYFNMLDYFFLTSKIDPCPIVILENLYLNKKIIVIKNNIYTNHIIEKLENYIYIDGLDPIKEFAALSLSKETNTTNKNSQYIIEHYSLPSIDKSFHTYKDITNFFLCSIYMNNIDISYYINIINQFIIRNNYNYKCVIALSSDTKHDTNIIKLIYKYLINLDHIILRDNIGYDIGGLIDGLEYIYTNNIIDKNSKLVYTHSKSNTHWKNINNKILYVDNIEDEYDTIVSKRFLAECKNDDRNKIIMKENNDIFSNNLIDNDFLYIQGTAFRTRTILLEDIYSKINIIKPKLTSINKNDTFWQSIMKDKSIFDSYFRQYTNNLFNHPIDYNSFSLIKNNLAKNYIELYKKFNMRGIPDCQIEHALERYVGFLITNKSKVYAYE